AAELGYRVTALDLSPMMLAQAKRKAEARGIQLETIVGPATEPPLGPFDALVERHLLWTVPDPVAALRAWRDVVVPRGLLVSFEGVFSAAGLAHDLRHAVAALARRVRKR